MPEVGLFWLLLPVAAGSGWLARARSERASRRAVSRLTTHYFRGLNYLLNEQQDKAIDVFLEIAEVDSDTIETQLALGNLFRRRGEADRAIRIHQNLIARPGLDPEQRTQALLELGEDYMRAGLLDRAENLFAELVELDTHTPAALRHLLSIYQQEQDWRQAIATAEELERATGQPMGGVIAHYYCELAESARRDEGDTETVDRWLSQAEAADSNCVRASIMRGQLAMARGDHEGAISAFRRVADQDMDYVSEIVEPLKRCYAASRAPERAEATLRELARRSRGVSPLLALAEVLRRREGEEAAGELVIEQLRQRPSVRGLDYLIGLSMGHADREVRDNLQLLRDLTRELLSDIPAYRCGQCGFGSKTLYWQCPSCKTWSSIKPIQGVAGE